MIFAKCFCGSENAGTLKIKQRERDEASKVETQRDASDDPLNVWKQTDRRERAYRTKSPADEESDGQEVQKS